MFIMQTLSKREVAQTPARLWATAEACAERGEDLWVTNRGKPSYRVIYNPQGENALAALEAAGVYTPPSLDVPRPPQVTGTYSREDIEAILDDMRDEW